MLPGTRNSVEDKHRRSRDGGGHYDQDPDRTAPNTFREEFQDTTSLVYFRVEAEIVPGAKPSWTGFKRMGNEGHEA